jgi:hypothetical protein
MAYDPNWRSGLIAEIDEIASLKRKNQRDYYQRYGGTEGQQRARQIDAFLVEQRLKLAELIPG